MNIAAAQAIDGITLSEGAQKTIELTAENLSEPNDSILSLDLTVTLEQAAANVNASVEGTIIFAANAENPSGLTLAFNKGISAVLSDSATMTSFTLSSITGTIGETISTGTPAIAGQTTLSFASQITATTDSLTAGKITLTAENTQNENVVSVNDVAITVTGSDTATATGTIVVNAAGTTALTALSLDSTGLVFDQTPIEASGLTGGTSSSITKVTLKTSGAAATEINNVAIDGNE